MTAKPALHAPLSGPHDLASLLSAPPLDVSLTHYFPQILKSRPSVFTETDALSLHYLTLEGSSNSCITRLLFFTLLSLIMATFPDVSAVDRTLPMFSKPRGHARSYFHPSFRIFQRRPSHPYMRPLVLPSLDSTEKENPLIK
jgi:hypothetical protein